MWNKTIAHTSSISIIFMIVSIIWFLLDWQTNKDVAGDKEIEVEEEEKDVEVEFLGWGRVVTDVHKGTKDGNKGIPTQYVCLYRNQFSNQLYKDV